MEVAWPDPHAICIHPSFRSDVIPEIFEGHIHGHAANDHAARVTATIHWLVLLAMATGMPMPDRLDL